MLSTVRLFSLACLLFVVAFASESDHKYQQDEAVTLWVNKVGPYNNPQETYNYYSLPFCQPQGNAGHKWGGLGEVLGGNELIDSLVEIKFRKNTDKTSICEIEMDAAKVKHFKDAIENTYWFEFFIDGLPLWGFVGEYHPDKGNDKSHLLYTHKSINIQYNGDQIIHVNLTQDSPRPLEAGKNIDLTYSVKWTPTNVTFARRFEVYLDYPFFEHQDEIAGGDVPKSIQCYMHEAGVTEDIPGTTRIENLNQNIGALSVKLSPEDMAELESIASEDVVKGDRYGGVSRIWKNSDTPELSSWKN